VAFDPAHHQVIVLGSMDGDIPDVPPGDDSTFVFDGKHWTSSRLPSALMGRVGQAVAWSSSACDVVLWGGYQGHGNAVATPVNYTDTWYRDGATWVNVGR
jgi:hypothetical protein